MDFMLSNLACSLKKKRLFVVVVVVVVTYLDTIESTFRLGFYYVLQVDLILNSHSSDLTLQELGIQI